MVTECDKKDKIPYNEWHINKEKQMMNKEDHNAPRQGNKGSKRVGWNGIPKEEKDDYQWFQLDIKSEKCLTQA